MVGVVTGLERVGGIGPQMYHAYPGCMEVREGACEERMRISSRDGFGPSLSGWPRRLICSVAAAFGEPGRTTNRR